MSQPESSPLALAAGPSEQELPELLTALDEYAENEVNVAREMRKLSDFASDTNGLLARRAEHLRWLRGALPGLLRAQRFEESYRMLADAVEASLPHCIREDDIAEEAIFVEAIGTAAMGLSEAYDVLHTVRFAAARDLGRKGNRTLENIIRVIDALWDESIPYARLHEARRAAASVAAVPEGVDRG